MEDFYEEDLLEECDGGDEVSEEVVIDEVIKEAVEDTGDTEDATEAMDDIPDEADISGDEFEPSGDEDEDVEDTGCEDVGCDDGGDEDGDTGGGDTGGDGGDDGKEGYHEADDRSSGKKFKSKHEIYKFPKTVFRVTISERPDKKYSEAKSVAKECLSKELLKSIKEIEDEKTYALTVYNLLGEKNLGDEDPTKAELPESRDRYYRSEKIRNDIEFRNITCPAEAEEGVYRCECGSNRTFSFSIQLRSADEPMTCFITCASCGKRWREN